MNCNKQIEIIKLTFSITENEDCRLSKDIDNILKKSDMSHRSPIEK